MNGQFGTRRGDNLLFLCPRKLTQNGLCNRSGRLNRQGVHKHMRSGSHDRQLARGFTPQTQSRMIDEKMQLQFKQYNNHTNPIAARWSQWKRKDSPNFVTIEVVNGASRVLGIKGAKLQVRNWSRGLCDQFPPPSAMSALM